MIKYLAKEIDVADPFMGRKRFRSNKEIPCIFCNLKVHVFVYVCMCIYTNSHTHTHIHIYA